jgi:hypothetical protein
MDQDMFKAKADSTKVMSARPQQKKPKEEIKMMKSTRSEFGISKKSYKKLDTKKSGSEKWN